MTDRLKGVYVAFDRDIRVDDAESLIAAIGHLRGVAGVELIVTDPADWMARTHVRSELSQALWKAIESVLYPKPPGKE